MGVWEVEGWGVWLLLLAAPTSTDDLRSLASRKLSVKCSNFQAFLGVLL